MKAVVYMLVEFLSRPIRLRGEKREGGGRRERGKRQDGKGREIRGRVGKGWRERDERKGRESSYQ